MTGEQMLDQLGPLIGRERNLHTVNYALKTAARQVNAGLVGALHVTCSDETEQECVDSFQSSFAADLLPRLRFSHRAPFRSSNLGGRYEWQSLVIAERNFAGPESRRTFKLLVIRIHSHVAVVSDQGGNRYGLFPRYGAESNCCGLLAAVLAGQPMPAAEEVRELLRSEGIDRLAMLNQEVEERFRPLAVAVTSARLQARNAVMEAQDHEPVTPTAYLIVPSVSFNKPDRDAELVCGVYWVDRRSGRRHDLYRGLGDRPNRFLFEESHGQVRVADEEVAVVRRARDHRRLIGEARRKPVVPKLAKDRKIDEMLERARNRSRGDHQLAKLLTQGLLFGLAEIAPVPAALLLFAEGASSIYHAHRAHRLVEEVDSSDEARRMLHDLNQRLEHSPPAEVEKVLRVLVDEYTATDGRTQQRQPRSG